MLIRATERTDLAHCNKSYEEPEICPLCGTGIKPEELFFGTFLGKDNRHRLAVLYRCPHCFQVFTSFHIEEITGGNWESYRLNYVGPSNYHEQTFDKHLSNLSPAFTKIYNQAKEAETLGLDEIAGIGYRKALEFLIKDYLIHLHPADAEKIKRMELGNCIANKISNEKLKIVASRCAWLGNDITHYVQRFEDRDTEDMKRFIEAVVYWVSMELTTEETLSIEKQDHK